MADVVLTAVTTPNLYGFKGQNPIFSAAQSARTDKYEDTYSWIGASYYNSNYNVFRTYWQFDLSSISTTIAEATLKFTGYSDQTQERDFNAQARGYTDTHISNIGSDSYNGYGTTSFGSVSSSVYSSLADGMSITLNSAGISYLNGKLGESFCVLSLVSDDDMDSDTPTAANHFGAYSPEYGTAAKRPHLELTYESGGAWTPRIIMIMSPLVDGLLEWIRKPLQQDMYLQI